MPVGGLREAVAGSTPCRRLPITDIPEPVATTASFDDYFAAEATRAYLRSELLPANKAAIFDALAAAGVPTVIVTFDGYGDSGQIESIDACDGAADMALPDVQVEFASPNYADADVKREALPLGEVTETLCYDLLGATHCGWENNDGAFGEFTFDVATRVISLEFNGRYTSIDSSGHDF